MGSKAMTTQHLTRQRSSLALAAVCGVTGFLLLVSMAWHWADHPQPLFAAWVLVGLALVWSLLVRPAVVLDDDGVTIRNVLRDFFIPWVRVTDVEFHWNLKVFAGDRPYVAWAISSQIERPKGVTGGMFAMLPGRLDAFAKAYAPPAAPDVKVSASTVARSIEQAMEEYAEAVAQVTLAAAPERQVRITWVPRVLVLLFLSAVLVVTLSLF